jgi:PAS domain S-box-containing protein
MSFTGCVYPGIHGLHFCRVCRKRIAEPCLYMHIVEDAHEIMLIVAEDGNIIEANPAAEKAYGYARDELVQMNVMQLRAPEAQQQKPWQFPPAHKSKVIVETKHRRKDGAIFPVEISSSRIQIAD